MFLLASMLMPPCQNEQILFGFGGIGCDAIGSRHCSWVADHILSHQLRVPSMQLDKTMHSFVGRLHTHVSSIDKKERVIDYVFIIVGLLLFLEVLVIL